MQTLKIHYCDFWPEWNQENFIEPILRKHFDVILDQKNPDVLFHSIFGGMRETPKYKCKKVLFLGENHRPSKFGSDFSISFDPHSDTNFRLPLWQAFALLDPKIKDRLFGPKINWEKSDFENFGAFIVSNPSNFFRNGAYSQLSEYKQINSYGRYLTNDKRLIEYSKNKYWRDAKDAFFLQLPHKFMFAFENSPYPGYCTEKLMDAFLVGSMPIYWGSPVVQNDFNPKAFINVMTNVDWINQVKKMDSDENLFRQMYKEPIFTEEQRIKHLGNMANLASFLIRILKQ